MDAPICEVIGCNRQAGYARTQPCESNLEDYLCARHYAELSHHVPSWSACYAPLASLRLLSEEDAQSLHLEAVSQV